MCISALTNAQIDMCIPIAIIVFDECIDRFQFIIAEFIAYKLDEHRSIEFMIIADVVSLVVLINKNIRINRMSIYRELTRSRTIDYIIQELFVHFECIAILFQTDRTVFYKQ